MLSEPNIVANEEMTPQTSQNVRNEVKIDNEYQLQNIQGNDYLSPSEHQSSFPAPVKHQIEILSAQSNEYCLKSPSGRQDEMAPPSCEIRQQI